MYQKGTRTSEFLPFEDIAICCAPPFATKLAGKSPQRVISEARSTSSLGLFSFLRNFFTYIYPILTISYYMLLFLSDPSSILESDQCLPSLTDSLIHSLLFGKLGP